MCHPVHKYEITSCDLSDLESLTYDFQNHIFGIGLLLDNFFDGTHPENQSEMQALIWQQVDSFSLCLSKLQAFYNLCRANRTTPDNILLSGGCDASSDDGI